MFSLSMPEVNFLSEIIALGTNTRGPVCVTFLCLLSCIMEAKEMGVDDEYVRKENDPEMPSKENLGKKNQ